MPLFSATFTVFSVTGTVSHGVGNYFLSDVTGSGTVAFSLSGNCLVLNGAAPVSLVNTPPGFIITGGLSLSMSPVVAFGARRGNLSNTAELSHFWGGFGPESIAATTAGVFFSIPALNISDPLIRVPHLFALYQIEFNTIRSVADALLIAQSSDGYILTGSYEIVQNSWTIDPGPYKVGEPVSIAAGSTGANLSDISEIQLVDDAGDIHVIKQKDFAEQTGTLLTFIIPPTLNGIDGDVVVTATGGGVQFSGTVMMGKFEILLVNGSGLYVLTAGKTDDTIYENSSVNNGTIDTAIPNPSFRTGFIG